MLIHLGTTVSLTQDLIHFRLCCSPSAPRHLLPYTYGVTYFTRLLSVCSRLALREISWWPPEPVSAVWVAHALVVEWGNLLFWKGVIAQVIQPGQVGGILTTSVCRVLELSGIGGVSQGIEAQTEVEHL